MAKKKAKSKGITPDQAAKKVKAELGKAQKKIVAVNKKVVALVKKHPKKAVAIAAAVAAAIGTVAWRALRKRK